MCIRDRNYIKTENNQSVVVECIPRICLLYTSRPQKAVLVLDEENILSCDPTKDEIEKFADYVEGKLTFGSNMRASKDFRSHLCKVLVKRCINEVGGM